jgi:16S rRNA (guanine527-N7)-methyltransferase
MRLRDRAGAPALTPEQDATLVRYIELLLKWNARINLTAARGVDDAAQHVIDCLAVVPHLPAGPARLVDVGSGGGLPAVMIATMRPDLDVTAVEPTHKKHAFLRTAARELALANLAAIATRLDDLPDASWDIATSRATFALADWLTAGLRLVRPGGLVLGLEGADQPDLPAGAVRHPYPLADRTRAIISLHRPA